jgi:hypothetical protein
MNPHYSPPELSTDYCPPDCDCCTPPDKQKWSDNLDDLFELKYMKCETHGVFNPACSDCQYQQARSHLTPEAREQVIQTQAAELDRLRFENRIMEQTLKWAVSRRKPYETLYHHMGGDYIAQGFERLLSMMISEAETALLKIKNYDTRPKDLA